MHDGNWHNDYYLFLNDEDRQNAKSFYSDSGKITKHEFKLTNTASEKQKVYVGVHTWDQRSYSTADKDCNYDTNFVTFNLPGATRWSRPRPKGFNQGKLQEVIEMEPGQEITGKIELNWNDDQA